MPKREFDMYKPPKVGFVELLSKYNGDEMHKLTLSAVAGLGVLGCTAIIVVSLFVAPWGVAVGLTVSVLIAALLMTVAIYC